jgi:tryptophanyl-tRNA synthetase
MADLRHAVGLRNLSAGSGKGGPKTKAVKAAKPSFKQYREKDGLFYFKLLDESGAQLLQSVGFASPQEAGKAIGALKAQRGAAIGLLAAQLEPVDNAAMLAASDALEALAADAASEKS